MAIEALLERIAVGLEANTAVLQVLNAGREASLEQLKKAGEAGDAAPARATRKKKTDEAPAGTAPNPAATTQTITEGAVTAPTTVSAADGLSAIEAELRSDVAKYVNAEGLTTEQSTARGDNMRAIMQHFGGGKLVGPQSTLDADERSQALFYVRRYAAGLPVDFSQDYDFAGDPTQGGTVAAGDDFDIG